MGRKIHPVGFRLKINRDWDARWFAEGNRYKSLLKEDFAIRRFIRPPHIDSKRREKCARDRSQRVGQ